MLLKVYYGQQGYDWISWFTDEKFSDSRKPLQAFNKNKREICKDIKGLWTIIEKDRKSKNFKEYVIPKPMTDEQRQKFLEEFFQNRNFVNYKL